MMAEPKVVSLGYRFPEGSRWRDGRLWFSDMHTGEVFSLDPATGEVKVVLTISGQTSGLGWIHGDLLVVSMLDRRVLRVRSGGRIVEHADLSKLTPYPINDMVVAADGQAFVGDFGYDLYGGKPRAGGPLFRVDPDGNATVAATGLDLPNGAVILPGTSTLVVAETWGTRLTAFDIETDGSLCNRRIWADLPLGTTPDGTCVDSQGGVWVSSLLTSEFIRVVEGGMVTARIPTPGRLAIDCSLGGADGRALLLLTANSYEPAETQTARAGQIETVVVAVPGPTA